MVDDAREKYVGVNLRLMHADWLRLHELALARRASGDPTASVQSVVIDAISGMLLAAGQAPLETPKRGHGGKRVSTKRPRGG